MPVRIMTTHSEFEGQIMEQRFVMEGEEPPAWGPEAELRLIGKPTPRVDGRERVSGAAKYTYDIQLPGMLYAAALRSPHPHARVAAITTSRAEALPGVRAVFTRFNASDLIDPNRGSPLLREELLYQGDAVALAVAETREAAEDALGLLDVTYAPLAFVADAEAAEKQGAPRVSAESEQNVLGDYPRTYERGDVERALAQAEARVEVRFETPCALHNCMEPHGTVATWDGRMLTAYVSTQDVYSARRTIASALGLQQNQVNVICHYMGGGFGSKFGVHSSGLLVAYAAHRLGCPVHYMLSREEENLAAGNRPPAVQTYRVGATKDGMLTALDLRALNNVGAQGSWASPITLAAKELYLCPNVRTVDVPVRTNLGTQAAFRAPGVVEGTAVLEVALDEIARATGVDPLELRRKNHAQTNQLLGGKGYASKSLLQAYEVGAERIGWATRNSAEWRFPKGRQGHLRRGMGMASQIWGGDGGPPAQALAKVLQDGTVVVVTGTQDIGTGTRTVLAQIAAEELGVPLSQVQVELGETEYGLFSPGSGGSMTLASMGPAVRMAAAELRKEILEVVSQLAEAPTDVLDVRDGIVYTRDTGREMGSIGSFVGQLDGHEISAKGMRGPNAEDVTVRTFGAHFADVEVDTGTGEVRVRRIVAVHDCGRIINPLTWSSQIEGGVIQGLGFALMEQRLVDERLGTVVNPNLETYEVPTIRDVPEIEIVGIGQPLAVANTIGALGAGEPPIIPTPGAIANAVAHALGRPVRRLPLTRDYILELMAQPERG